MLMLSPFYDKHNVKAMKNVLLACVTLVLSIACKCCLTYHKAIRNCKLDMPHIVECNCPVMITQNPLPEANV